MDQSFAFSTRFFMEDAFSNRLAKTKQLGALMDELFLPFILLLTWTKENLLNLTRDADNMAGAEYGW